MRTLLAKSWQTAFVTGVVACVITAVIVLGQALATAIVSIVSLIITVINALLNLEPDKGGEPRTFSSFLKNMLYVGPLLKGATLVVWCGVLGLAAYGTLTHIQASRLVTIKGMVLTATGDPGRKCQGDAGAGSRPGTHGNSQRRQIQL